MLRMALAVGVLAEDVVVEHRLLERDREHFLRPEADRVRELLRVVDAADLEHPHADSIVGDAQADVLAGELVLLEEGAQRGGERVRVAELAADDDAVLEVLACDLRTCATPLFTTWAAAIWDAPTFRPTSFFLRPTDV